MNLQDHKYRCETDKTEYENQPGRLLLRLKLAAYPDGIAMNLGQLLPNRLQRMLNVANDLAQ